MSRTAWPVAKVIRHQLQHVADRLRHRSSRGEQDELTAEQASAILAPLDLAIANALIAEQAPPSRVPRPPGTDVVIENAPSPGPESLAEAVAMHGMAYGAPPFGGE